jgi:hypothetical protein
VRDGSLRAQLHLAQDRAIPAAVAALAHIALVAEQSAGSAHASRWERNRFTWNPSIDWPTMARANAAMVRTLSAFFPEVVEIAKTPSRKNWRTENCASRMSGI